MRVPAARSRLWVIAARTVQAALAANKPEGWWAQGPSMRSDQTVSQMAWSRWVMSAWVDGFGVVGEERVVAPDREQRVLGVGVQDPPHDQTRGDLVAGVGERGVLHFGHLRVGDQLAGVGVFDRAGVLHRHERVVGDGAIAASTALLWAMAKENLAPALTTAAMIFPPQ